MGQTALDRRVEYTGEDSVPQGSGALNLRRSVFVAVSGNQPIGDTDSRRDPTSNAAPQLSTLSDQLQHREVSIVNEEGHPC